MHDCSIYIGLRQPDHFYSCAHGPDSQVHIPCMHAVSIIILHCIHLIIENFALFSSRAYVNMWLMHLQHCKKIKCAIWHHLAFAHQMVSICALITYNAHFILLEWILASKGKILAPITLRLLYAYTVPLKPLCLLKYG